MVGHFRKFTRALGFDIARFPGAATHWPRLVEMLARRNVSLVLDVGANTGQYATSLRHNGYAGRIVSYEPLSNAHQTLSTAARRDANWEIAPRTAIGAAAGEAEINISPESDMSSLLPLSDDAAEKLKSVRSTARESVPVTTLAVEIPARAKPADAVFVKSDTQGYEAEVLAGLGAAAARVIGIQVELSLAPIYDGQPDHLSILARLRELGFTPHFIIPGYYSRHHGRMIEYDAVCFREGAD